MRHCEDTTFFPCGNRPPVKKTTRNSQIIFPSVLPLKKIKQEAAVWFEMHSVSSKNIKGPPGGGGPFAEISGGRTNRDCSAVPPGSAFSKSIFSLKCFAFQTIRPVVSRKKRGFSAHFGPGGAVPPPRVSPFSKLKRSNERVLGREGGARGGREPLFSRQRKGVPFPLVS